MCHQGMKGAAAMWKNSRLHGKAVNNRDEPAFGGWKCRTINLTVLSCFSCLQEKGEAMSGKSIIVIGAGIGGLAMGCYARMNGYPTTIFELHTVPGGLCTAWKRKGYTFDGCLHDLAGISSHSSLNFLWEELGALQGREIMFHEEFWRVESPDGQVLKAYTSIDEMERHLKTLSPEDGAVIDEMIRGARMMTRFELFSVQAGVLSDLFKMVPRLGGVMKWGRVNMTQFAGRFKHPFIRKALPMLQYDFPEVPMLIFLNFLAYCNERKIGWPEGGSLVFANAIARRYRALGGELRLGARVEKILVKDDRAVGVRLADGSEHYADRVLSAADGYTTIFKMLDGKYINQEIRDYYDHVPDFSLMNVHISLGVNLDLAGQPRAVTLLLPEPVTIAGEEMDRLDVEVFSFDPSLAPRGKSVIKVLMGSRYSFWKALSEDLEQYEAAKQEAAERVIAALEPRFPGLKAQLEVVDVATPLTTERFTGNYHGTQAWFPEKGFLKTMTRGLTKTLPGLENFYMTGQWMGGRVGLNTTAATSRSLAKELCQEDGKQFVTYRD